MREKRVVLWILATVLVLCALVLPNEARAATTQGLHYSVEDGEVTITGCDNSVSGEVVIPKTIEGYPVTTIGAWAFMQRIHITQIKLPNSVKTIEEHAFALCYNLTKVSISASVTEIQGHPFQGCTKLTTVTVAAKNTAYSADAQGVLFNKKKTKLIAAPGALEGSYSLPGTVKTIGNSAFSSCTKLTSVRLPDALKTIEAEAFKGCTMAKLTIPAGVTKIASDAFADCQSLKKIVVNKDNKVYSSDSSGVLFNKSKTVLINAPGGLSGSYILPHTVELIGAAAFSGCSGLTKLTVCNAVRRIEYAAFDDSGITKLDYLGTMAQWDAIDIDALNERLTHWIMVYTNKSPVKVTAEPVDRHAVAGNTARFSVKASGDGLTYQWQYRPSLSEDWKNASATGNKRATVSIPATLSRSGYQYRCRLTDRNGNVLYSAVVKLSVLGIQTQPTDQYLPAGKTAKFAVKAQGTGLKYQWQYRPSLSEGWKNASATGNRTATLQVPVTASRNGFQYRCVITDQYGSVIYSDTVTLNVVTLKITAQPVSRTAAEGKTVSFTVKAQGTGLKYQWQYRTSPKGAWKTALAEGNTTAALKVPVTASRNDFQYRCVITDQYGNVINSAVVTLKVK